jgi:hypothetical protein
MAIPDYAPPKQKPQEKSAFRLEMSAFIFITAWRLECGIAKASPNG